MAACRLPTSAVCGSNAATKRALVTGGSGYLGFRLATQLAKEGVQVVLLDISPPSQPLPPGLQFVAGSVADEKVVDAAFSSAIEGPLDAVFHVASYGMSGRELRDLAKIESVNVGGTRRIISSCLRHGVPRLVYVSTCNVIFVGKCISGGDESAPYPPPSAYKDHYSATKARAERLVREANGLKLRQPPPHTDLPQPASTSSPAPFTIPLEGDRPTGQQCDPSTQTLELSQCEHKGWSRGGEDVVESSGGFATRLSESGTGDCRRLYTCCIRSTGIWGPGETRHQPRVIRMVQAGLFRATFGNPSSITDWIHVDNLVQMLIKAERALCLPQQPQPPPSPLQQQQQQQQPGPMDESKPTAVWQSGQSGPGVTGPSAPVAAGQVYYASDGAPLNNFDHFRPIIVGLGYPYPHLNVPFIVVYVIAAIIEYLWPLLSALMVDPPLTCMEVDKCGIQHWFDISKARRELGYEPVTYDRAEVVRHMAAAGWAAKGARRQR